MSITLDDIKVALAIIENGEGREISLRSGDIELSIRRGPPGMAAPSAPPPVALSSSLATAPAAEAVAPAHPPAPAGSVAPPSPTSVPLRAPLTGVIYRSPAPDEPPFVMPGVTVSEDTILCIIDVMKVMNLIKAPVAGRIGRIDVEDGQLVSKDDVVMWVEPA